MIENIKRHNGDIIELVNNPFCIYEGTLEDYVRIIFSAPNIYHRYHGLRHMLHVTWVCYLACKYYRKLDLLDERQSRNLLIAALFHDFDHVGRAGDDSENIKTAIASMRKSLLPCDTAYAEDIASIIKATEFPHANLGLARTLEMAVIRDADISQAFGTAWIGEIVAGLGSEQNKNPLEMLKQQLKFLKNIHFSCDFGKFYFGQATVDAKIEETRGLISILEA